MSANSRIIFFTLNEKWLLLRRVDDGAFSGRLLKILKAMLQKGFKVKVDKTSSYLIRFSAKTQGNF
jgi:hypothetical protein